MAILLNDYEPNMGFEIGKIFKVLIYQGLKSLISKGVLLGDCFSNLFGYDCVAQQRLNAQLLEAKDLRLVGQW